MITEAELDAAFAEHDTEDELNARVFERADEGGYGSALIADGADGPWPHVESPVLTKMDGCQ